MGLDPLVDPKEYNAALRKPARCYICHAKQADPGVGPLLRVRFYFRVPKSTEGHWMKEMARVFYACKSCRAIISNDDAMMHEGALGTLDYVAEMAESEAFDRMHWLDFLRRICNVVVQPESQPR